MVRVDYASLHAAASDVRSTYDNTRGYLNTLSSTIDELSGAWKGQAATSFQDVMVNWNTDVNNLLTALSDIADMLDKSGDTHQVNDEEQASAMAKYTDALNC